MSVVWIVLIEKVLRVLFLFGKNQHFHKGYFGEEMRVFFKKEHSHFRIISFLKNFSLDRIFSQVERKREEDEKRQTM